MKQINLMLIAALISASCSQKPQSKAEQTKQMTVNSQEYNIILDETKKISQNAAEIFDLGVVHQGSVNKAKYSITNNTLSSVSLNIAGLQSQLAGIQRYSISNITCGTLLKIGKTCSFDISLNYLELPVVEDYSEPVIASLISGQSNPEFGKVIFSGLKANDSITSVAMSTVFKVSNMMDSLVIGYGKSVTKRYYIGNISTKAYQAPIVIAPSTGTIGVNNCVNKELKPNGTCSFDVTYSNSGAYQGVEDITFLSNDSQVTTDTLKISLNINKQAEIIPVVTASFQQFGFIDNLGSTTQSTRIYVTNTGSNTFNPSTIVIPEHFTVKGSNCLSELKIGKTCFFDLNLNISKTANMNNLVAPISLAANTGVIKVGDRSATQTACAVGYSIVNNLCIGAFTPSVTQVVMHGSELKIIGSGLATTADIKIKKANGSLINLNSIQKFSGYITAQLATAASFAVNEAIQILISDASAQEVPVSLVFMIDNGSIATSKLSGALGGSGVSAGQTLVWNGSDWVASNMASSQMFITTYDASTGLPALSSTPQVGDYYIVSKDGSQNINGSGMIQLHAGDQLMYDGSSWKRIASTSLIKSVFGRIGDVVPQAGDYSWDLLLKENGKLKNSHLGEIEDVDFSVAPGADQYLGYDTVSGKWIPKTVVIPSQQVLNSNIADAEISISKVNGLQTVLNSIDSAIQGKEPLLPAGGSSAHYLRGDKTWHSLDTASVPENGNLYFTNSRAVSALSSSLAGKQDGLNGSSSITVANVNTTTLNGIVVPDWSLFETISHASSTYVTPSQQSTAISNAIGLLTPTSVGLANLATGASGIQVKGLASGSSAFPGNDSKAALDIAGSAITRTYTLLNTSSGIDLSKSNSISVGTQSAATVALSGIQDGGSYTIAFTDSSTLTPAFTLAGAESGAPALTLKVYPSLVARTANKHFVMSLTRIGSFVYMSWQEF